MRVLIPSSRWFLRRRINRVIEEIGTRLDIEIRPFQLTKRQVLVDRLVYDPVAIESVRNYARDQDMPLEVVQDKVAVYAREIIPSFNAYFYYGSVLRQAQFRHPTLSPDIRAVYPHGHPGRGLPGGVSIKWSEP